MIVKEYVLSRKEAIKNEIAKASVIPCLAIVQVNDDPASDAYIKGKLKDSAEVGINALHVKLDPSISEEELLKKIDELNNDPSVHGLIVQMPLPKHISEDKVKLAVNPAKDVDGFHPLSTFVACTPKGIMMYLKSEGVEFAGKNAVVVGRSNIVGRPMAKLLLDASSNVTVIHSKTTEEDKKKYLANADIIVVAVGRKWFLNSSYTLKDSAVLVDVGINRVDGKLHGDIEPNLPVRLQTPVPGGVGLLTRLALLENLMEAYNKNN